MQRQSIGLLLLRLLMGWVFLPLLGIACLGAGALSIDAILQTTRER